MSDIFFAISKSVENQSIKNVRICLFSSGTTIPLFCITLKYYFCGFSFAPETTLRRIEYQGVAALPVVSLRKYF